MKEFHNIFTSHSSIHTWITLLPDRKSKQANKRVI